MSDTISLEFIGRNLRDIQTELRIMRSIINRLDDRIVRLENRLDTFEAVMEVRLDQQTLLIDRRFDQLMETMKANK